MDWIKIEKKIQDFLNMTGDRQGVVANIILRSLAEMFGIAGYGVGDVMTAIEVVRDILWLKLHNLGTVARGRLGIRIVIKTIAVIIPGVPSAWIAPVVNSLLPVVVAKKKHEGVEEGVVL